MPRTRVVLETTDQHKSAMVTAASLQGASLSDWFEEYIQTALPLTPATDRSSNSYSVVSLENQQATTDALRAQDWSFTDDDTRYLTHDLHPYPAKFIPQLPAHLIATLSSPGDVVFDPFGGSATTAVEAVRLGRRALSFDANPLSALIGRVKTGYMTPHVRADLEQLSATVEGHIISHGDYPRGWASTLTQRYREFLPDIPNLKKWFGENAIGELCLLRHLIDRTTEGLSRDAAHLALSRIVIRVSYQESETRYVAVEKDIHPTLTLRSYLESLRMIVRRLNAASSDLQFADAKFITADSRSELVTHVGENAVDLIVTSPPYPNATDYHLYHRFRLFWLGHDPRDLGRIEIGSHLRHQRNNTGFDEYRDDMIQALDGCSAVLMPGRYAVFVVGDALFKGEVFEISDAIDDAAENSGFDVCGVIHRPLHRTKRSFAKAGRRARDEQLVILRKVNAPVTVRLDGPGYRMWDYEEGLRHREIEALTGAETRDTTSNGAVVATLRQPALSEIRRLAFTHSYVVGENREAAQPTWQKVLENGDTETATRKDPKYATHGLHPFKGKFYPQLAKALMNMSRAGVGSVLLDPYCGSGTTLVEGMLNGFGGYGCELNPLAAKMARAKTGILVVSRAVVDQSIRAMSERLKHRKGRLARNLDQFEPSTHSELVRWFAEPVLYKLNWILGQARLFGDRTLVDFFEIIASSIVREVSNQDPTDLRIRRRKTALEDAPVLELFEFQLAKQHERLQQYWVVAGRQPSRLMAPMIVTGDSREQVVMKSLGLGKESVDCVVTSPPYATALPYIDTDRLSLMAIMGVTRSVRSSLEHRLTGSREIKRGEKMEAEERLLGDDAGEVLPPAVVKDIRAIYEANERVEVGFRRANMPALLWRYLVDIKSVMQSVVRVLKPESTAFYVVGNSRTKAGENWVEIETCKYVELIGEMVGLEPTERVDISVTKENLKHIKNAITRNQVIALKRRR